VAEPWRDYLLAGVFGALAGGALLLVLRDRLAPSASPAAPVAPVPAFVPEPQECPLPIVAVEVTNPSRDPAPHPPAAEMFRRAPPKTVLRDFSGVKFQKDPKSGARQLVVDPFPEEGPPRRARPAPKTR